MGTYSHFLTRRFISGIRTQDLPLALKWVRQQRSRNELRHSHGELLDELLKFAASNLDQSGLLAEFAKTILDRLRKHDLGVHSEEWLQRSRPMTNGKGLCVVEAILSELALSQDGQTQAPMFMWGSPLLTPSDFNWLANRMEQEVNHERQVVLAQWLRGAWNPMVASQTDKIIGLTATIPAARERFLPDLSPVLLDSERASAEREMHKRRDRWQQREEENERLRSTALQEGPGSSGAVRERGKRMCSGFWSGNSP